MNNKQINALREHACLSCLARSVSSEILDVSSGGTVVWSPKVLEQYGRYIELIEEWNGLAGLMSPHDVAHVVERHVVDAMSLAPYVGTGAEAGNQLLDIGSGGGFPAIPLKVIVPGLGVTLVERNDRKAAFLDRVVKVLGLSDVRVVQGEFPAIVREQRSDWVTARAVEKPERIMKGLKGYLDGAAVFLCQFREPEPFFGEMFHVEHIEDEWTRQGWRRGCLSLVRRAQ